MSLTNYSEYKEEVTEGTLVMDLHLESVMGRTSPISFDMDALDVIAGYQS